MGAPTTERAAITRLIRALNRAGAKPTFIDNGEDRVDVRDMGERKVLAEMFQTDREHLRLQVPNGPRITLDFVYGNDPFDMLCDFWPCDGPLGETVERELERWDN